MSGKKYTVAEKETFYRQVAYFDGNVAAAARRNAIPYATAHGWWKNLDEDERAVLVESVKKDALADWRIILNMALARAKETIAQASTRDTIGAAHIADNHIQIHTGGVTSRTETLHGELAAKSTDELIAVLDGIRKKVEAELAEEVDASGAKVVV